MLRISSYYSVNCDECLDFLTEPRSTWAESYMAVRAAEGAGWELSFTPDRNGTPTLTRTLCPRCRPLSGLPEPAEVSTAGVTGG